jgi:hypothetical protein
LEENVEHRKVDVRSLVARTLARLGRFDALVESFSDDTQHSAWEMHFDELLISQQRGPESARLLGEAFTRVYEDDGDPLYRLVWGFDEDQLRDGGAAELVEYLDHDALEFRALSFENLRRITGSSHLYDPKNLQARRRRAVAEWRRELDDGRIVYKRPPTSLPIPLEELPAGAGRDPVIQ